MVRKSGKNWEKEHNSLFFLSIFLEKKNTLFLKNECDFNL